MGREEREDNTTCIFHGLVPSGISASLLSQPLALQVMCMQMMENYEGSQDHQSSA